jgi:hypothetical protein
MKKRLFSTAVLALFISLFCSDSFAQPDPGGSAGGEPDGHPISQPSPISFKRNNGNGTCRGEAEIRVAFNLIPDYMPALEEIKYQGNSIGFVLGNIDTSQVAKKGYASYCIMSGNLPPAKKLALKFHYTRSNQTFWLVENDELLADY